MRSHSTRKVNQEASGWALYGISKNHEIRDLSRVRLLACDTSPTGRAG
jgi:hypothetical protein